ncbi:MAG: hypothetical protein WAV38_08915 [Xanthobacteraceae bacterium]
MLIMDHRTFTSEPLSGLRRIGCTLPPMGKFTLSLSECPRQFWNPSLPCERARFDWQFGHQSPGKTVKQRHNLRLLFVRPLRQYCTEPCFTGPRQSVKQFLALGRGNQGASGGTYHDTAIGQALSDFFELGSRNSVFVGQLGRIGSCPGQANSG